LILPKFHNHVFYINFVHAIHDFPNLFLIFYLNFTDLLLISFLRNTRA